MATCEIITTTSVRLVLSAKEALFIKSLVQNYLGPEDVPETHEHAYMRCNIFHRLPDFDTLEGAQD